MKVSIPLGGATALVLLSSMAAVLTPRDPVCQLTHESAPALAAARSLERVHVARDLANVEREAERFGRAVARRPLASDSIDAREGARTAPIRAVAWCRTTLIAELASVHGTSAAGLLAAAAGDAAQAGTERTSRVDATSSVVSRPSR